jgi:protocatechuate 3,4-dioxygenase beta subunit
MPINARSIILVLAVLALTALVWWQLASGPSESVLEHTDISTSRSAADPLQAKAEREVSRVELEGAEAEASDEEGASNTEENPETGSLLLRVIFAADKSLAAGVRLRARPINRHGLRPRYTSHRTDEEGIVRIADLPPGRVYVVAERKPMRGKALVVEAGKETEYVFELSGGITLTGLVVDKDEVPVSDAQIVIASWAGAEARVVSRTDEQGRFHLREVEKTVNVGARAEGFTPSPMRTVMAGKGATIDVRLILPAAGGSVRGTVVDDAGAGVPDADVRLGFLGPATRGITLPDGSRGHQAMAVITKTDPEGRFTATGLPPGEIPIWIRADEFAPHHGGVTVVEHAPSDATIRLQRGARCVGTVRSEKGLPLGGIDVTHAKYDSPMRRSTRTEEDGTYVLAGLPAGSLEFRVRTKAQGGATTKLAARPGETICWDVTLSRGLVIEGVVTDKDGKPLKGAYVEVIGPMVGKDIWSRLLIVDEQGRFELVDAPHDAVLQLTVQAREHKKIRRSVKTSGGRLLFKLEYLGKPTARVIGMLVDPDGKPISSAQIILRGPESGGGLRPTTKEGKILLEKLYAGRYTLHVSAGAYPSWTSKPFDLAAGATHDVGQVRLSHGGFVRFKLKRPDPELRFGLLLLEPDGKTYSGAYISTTKDPIRSVMVAPGRYIVRTTGKSIVRRDVPVTVEVGTDTVVPLTLQVGVRCDFEFELPAELEPGKQIQVSLTGVDYVTELDAFRHLDGVYRCTVGLPPGSFNLKASTDVGYRGSRAFEVVAGKARKIETRMK